MHSSLLKPLIAAQDTTISQTGDWEERDVKCLTEHARRIKRPISFCSLSWKFLRALIYSPTSHLLPVNTYNCFYHKTPVIDFLDI